MGQRARSRGALLKTTALFASSRRAGALPSVWRGTTGALSESPHRVGELPFLWVARGPIDLALEYSAWGKGNMHPPRFLCDAFGESSRCAVAED